MLYFLKNIKLTLFFLFLSISSQMLWGQSITGVIMNEDKIPIEYATVVLQNPVDSSFIAGGTSSQSGMIHITIPHSDKLVSISVSCLGYITKKLEIQVNRDTVSLGEVILQQDPVSLETVLVSAPDHCFKRDGSSLIANVSSSILSSAGTANDILEKIPGILVKSQSITVFGKGKPLIYIDNRKLYDESELNRLSSTDISTIKLINNPGAEYDAEGRAVLLIKTKKNTMKGLAVQLSEQLYQSRYFGDQENLGLSYTLDKITFYTSYNHSYLKNYRNPRATYTIYSDTLWRQTIDLPQIYKNKNNNFVAGFDWTIHEKHTLGVQYRGTFGREDVDSEGKEIVTANHVNIDEIRSNLHSENKIRKDLVNLLYAGNYGNSLQILVDADYMTTNNDGTQKVDEFSSIENRDLHFLIQSDFALYAAKLTLIQKYNDDREIGLGGEYSLVKGDGKLENKERFVPDNIYHNREEKATFFAYLSDAYGNLNFQAGLRGEFVTSEFENEGVGENNRREIFSLFPNVSGSINMGDVEMSLSYARKTKRPSFSMLNNNYYYLNRFLSQSGNPSLKNELINQIDYQLSYKDFNLDLAYIYTQNPIGMYLENVAGNSSHSVISYANFTKAQEINILLSYEYKYKKWQVQLTPGLRQPFFSANYLGQQKQWNQTTFSIGCSNDLMFEKGYILSANFNYQGASDYYIERSMSYKSLDLSLRKSFFNKKFLVKIQLSDVFNWETDDTRIQVNNISYQQNSVFDSRYLSLSVSYKFNNYKNKNKESNAAKEDIERL